MKTDSVKYLIVGNSTAAVGAIEGLRATDAESSAMVVSRENHHTYSRPLISHLLAGEVDEERMYWRPRDFYRVHRIEPRLGVAVESLDLHARTASLADGGRVGFERLLLASGGRPFVPPLEGSNARGVFTFTSWADESLLDEHIKAGARRAVVIGGGLIGIKAAEALRARTLEVTIVELADRVLPLALDEHGSAMAARAIGAAGVELVCGTSASRIVAPDGAVASVELKTGRSIPADTVVVAIGVVPDLALVKGTPVKTDRGILVDTCGRTSVEGVFAAGDVAQGTDMLTGLSRPIPIFPGAYRRGFVAGITMAGGVAEVTDSFAMNSVEVFGLPTISVGLSTASGPEFEVLVLADEAANTYKRIVLRGGRVVGALMVGAIDRAGIFTGLIRHRVDVSAIRHLLLTDQFGVISLPAAYRTHVVQGEGIEMMTTATAVAIDAEGIHYRELNERIRAELDAGSGEILLTNVRGQRYIGAGLPAPAAITVEGIPGNDLACFMNGARLAVKGNAQDGVANTMTAGTVTIDGDVGDVLAYAMRGGTVLVRGSAGYRVGIHMKAYGTRVPLVVVGGSVGDYAGEYMAGGTLVVLGLDRPAGRSLHCEFIGTGMHGGEIYLRGTVAPYQLGREVGRVPIDDEAWESLSEHLELFTTEFGMGRVRFDRSEFVRLKPVSNRPYGKVYVY